VNNTAEFNGTFREMNFALPLHDKWHINIAKHRSTAMQIIHPYVWIFNSSVCDSCRGLCACLCAYFCTRTIHSPFEW